MMKNFKGTFYLVQPAEYLGTNIFKMGLTRATEPPYKRLKDYKEGTIVYLTLLINAVNIFHVQGGLVINKSPFVFLIFKAFCPVAISPDSTHLWL